MAGELTDVYLEYGARRRRYGPALRRQQGRSGRVRAADAERTAAAMRGRLLSPTNHAVTPRPPYGYSVGTRTTDCTPARATRSAALAGLKPSFREDRTLTAGNCCPLNAARGMVILSDLRCGRVGSPPLAASVSPGGVSAGCPRSWGAPDRGDPQRDPTRDVVAIWTSRNQKRRPSRPSYGASASSAWQRRQAHRGRRGRAGDGDRTPLDEPGTGGPRPRSSMRCGWRDGRSPETMLRRRSSMGKGMDRCSKGSPDPDSAFRRGGRSGGSRRCRPGAAGAGGGRGGGFAGAAVGRGVTVQDRSTAREVIGQPLGRCRSAWVDASARRARGCSGSTGIDRTPPRCRRGGNSAVGPPGLDDAIQVFCTSEADAADS